jgi:hypothetical protein
MPANRGMRRSGGELLVLFLLALLPASGQGMQNVLHSGARLFPTVGPGVSALKRDAAGHYYILADPANTVLVFDSSGRRLGQIPNANSRGATIHYAVSIDLDPHGLLYVADRGDNAIKIFTSSGAPVANISVTAPTSVVALSDGQFAVTKLQSKRLVQIMDQSGATIRTFGDPTDQPNAAAAAQPVPGTSSAKQPLPVVDRGRITGDPSGNIYFAFTTLDDPAIQRFDRYGYSAYDSVLPATDFGALSGRNGREVQLGYTMSSVTGPATVSTWTDLHSVKTSVYTGSRGHGGQLYTGGLSGNGAGSAGGSAGGSPATDSSTSAIAADSSDLPSAIVSYDGQSASADSDSEFLLPPGLGSPGLFMPGMMGMGLADPFHFGGIRGAGLGNFGAEGPRPETFGGRPPDGSEGFGHFHGGGGTYRAAATLRLGLDDPSKHQLEKPVITAVGIDPQTQDAWAAIGEMLAHLDTNGNLVDTYYVTITGDTTIRPTALLVEADRILIASDPWGIYEFPRPDKSSPAQTTHQLSPAPPAQR